MPGSFRLSSVIALRYSIAYLAGGCVTDHDLLAEHPSPDASASAIVDAGSPSMPADAHVDVRADVADSSPEGPSIDANTPTSLTLVHGITDSIDPIQFCFAPVRDGIEQDTVGMPLPASGLPYAASEVVPSLSGIDWDVDGFRPYILAGDLTAVAGLDCAAAVVRARDLMQRPADGGLDAADGSTTLLDASDAEAGPPAPPLPPIRVAALPMIPAGTVAHSRSYLLVAYGCIGGPAYTDRDETSVCGDYYTPENPTLQPALVELGGPPSGMTVGLQFMNANSQVLLVNVRSVPTESSSLTSYAVASNVVTGQLVPSIPKQDRSASELGINSASAVVQVLVSHEPNPIYEESWPNILVAGDVGAVEDGRSYTLVFVGPNPAFGRKKWWNGAVVTIVPNAPAPP